MTRGLLRRLAYLLGGKPVDPTLVHGEEARRVLVSATVAYRKLIDGQVLDRAAVLQRAHDARGLAHGVVDRFLVDGHARHRARLGGDEDRLTAALAYAHHATMDGVVEVNPFVVEC